MGNSYKAKGDNTYIEWIKHLEYVEKTIANLLLEIFEKNIGIDPLEEVITNRTVDELEFYHINDPDLKRLEIEEIKRQITKLSHKVATKYSLRYKKAKHGHIDMRRTIHNALKTDGIPIYLKYHRKIINKPELVLLCDVSQSVEIFSEFMLQLVYTIQNKFRSVRSFLFVDIIDEATSYFQNDDIAQALVEAFGHVQFSYSDISDFGRVFNIFSNKYLSKISPKSTVFILGDARNNGYPSDKEYLEKITQHVKKTIWLNPQPRDEWNKLDSIMNVYAPYCDQVFECCNMNQLKEVMEGIL